MKKIFITFLLVIMSLQVMSTGVFAKEKEQPKYKPEIDAPEPVIPKEESEVLSKGSVYSVLSCPSEDQYEENDSFATATQLSSNSIISATISDVPWYCSGGNDLVDYYYFTTTRQLSLTIELRSLPEDYDLKLIDEDGNFMVGSYYGGTTNEMITQIVGPGTYFVKVYPAFSDKYDNYDSYYLEIDSDIMSPSGIDIKQSIKDSNVGVLWTSQYFPKNIHPNDYTGQSLYSETTNDRTPFTLRMLEEEGLYDTYVSRVVYLWDEETKAELQQSLESMITLFKTEGIDETSTMINFGVEYDVTNVLLAELSIFAAGSTFPQITIAMSAIALLLPDEGVSIDSALFYTYIGTLSGVLLNSPESEIIEIRENFTVYEQITFGYSFDLYQYYVNYEVERYLASEMLLDGTYVSRFISGNPFYGEVSLIQNKDDLPLLVK